MTRTMKTCSTALALIMVTAAPSLAQTTWTYSDIDQDGNLELSSVEFDTLGRELFVTWDANADLIVGEDEFYSGVYDAWDVDGDGILTEAEYMTGWDTWFSDYDVTAYSDLDLDGNAELVVTEFDLGETEIYNTWAAGGELGEEQFVVGLYDIYDTDDDMIVTEAEYDVVGSFWTSDVDTATTLEAEVVSLADWNYDDLYAGGLSAEDFIDDMDVYDATGEEVGEVEDIIIGSDGRIVSIIAEVGGFWDIGDTHVSIPFDQVDIGEIGSGPGLIIPVTEETIEDYGFDQEVFSAVTAATEMITEVDDAPVVRGWRASELIGDYARIRNGEAYANYGYISDLILRDGAVAAVVIQPDTAYGTGYRAYPYYGYDAGYGWDAGSPYYDMPYDAREVGEVEVLNYDRFE